MNAITWKRISIADESQWLPFHNLPRICSSAAAERTDRRLKFGAGFNPMMCSRRKAVHSIRSGRRPAPARSRRITRQRSSGASNVRAAAQLTPGGVPLHGACGLEILEGVGMAGDKVENALIIFDCVIIAAHLEKQIAAGQMRLPGQGVDLDGPLQVVPALIHAVETDLGKREVGPENRNIGR